MLQLTLVVVNMVVVNIQAPGLQDLLAKYPDVFQKGLGTQEASLVVDSDAVPRFNKARRLPYAMRTKVEDELERLVREGTVDYSVEE